MKRFDLVEDHVRLILKDNVLAVLSESELSVISGAIYNGGFRRTRAIVNIEVPEKYGNRRLHEDPISFILASAKKLNISKDFVGLVTAAKIKNFSLAKLEKGELSINVIATAGCSHAESAGESIEVEEITGTINVIVVVDGSPTESCLVALLATTVEAKAAAMQELDIRSRYSGELATGTITDSVAVATTNRGKNIVLGGPASELGQLVGRCVRKAVKEAITNQGECLPSRSISDRLRERHLSVEKMAFELSKIRSLASDEETLNSKLREIIADPITSSLLMVAVKIDEDIQKGLFPSEFGDGGELLAHFKKIWASKPLENSEVKVANLPPFLCEVLIALIQN